MFLWPRRGAIELLLFLAELVEEACAQDGFKQYSAFLNARAVQ
jgi:hypothetical protein